MKKNKDLCIEICSLTEKGYLLTDNQRDLTLIQKLFYSLAYPVFDEAQKEAMESEERGGSSYNEREAWKERYREQVEKKRERMRND